MDNKSSSQPSIESLNQRIRVARGTEKADLVIKAVEFLDVFNGEFRQGDIAILDDRIVGISESYQGKQEISGAGLYAVPGFIDAHVHIESSLMTPQRFQEAVLPCGTTTVIWDPHEIANVKGIDGIKWALASSEGLLLDAFVMVPSCVPSTSPQLALETSGASLVAAQLQQFRGHPRVLGLAEMMNFPGLLHGDADVLQKLADFSGLSLDGHCPGLTGRDLNAYAATGIQTCHESISLTEAQEKLMKGIHVLIREGSCAKNAQTLLPLLNSYSSAVLGFCSDDRNPADIAAEGHISFIIDLALKSGLRPEDVFRSASFAPAQIYRLPHRGAIAPGYLADICLVRQRSTGRWQDGISVAEVIKRGQHVNVAALRQEGRLTFPGLPGKNMHVQKVLPTDFNVDGGSGTRCAVRVIDVIPHQIITEESRADLEVVEENIVPAIDLDVLKIVVVERHHNTQRKSVAFVRGFGLKRGAIATSINHDSHNIIAVGATERDLSEAINRLIDIDGGIVVYDGRHRFEQLSLPIAGLMTDATPEEVSASLTGLKALAHELGCSLSEPFLQLSFLALPVIPKLKITDRGLVDVTQFKVVSVTV